MSVRNMTAADQGNVSSWLKKCEEARAVHLEPAWL